MLTPEQKAALSRAIDDWHSDWNAGGKTDEWPWMFAAGLAHGIAQERARCAKVCRVLARTDAELLCGALACADAIESPTEA